MVLTMILIGECAIYSKYNKCVSKERTNHEHLLIQTYELKILHQKAKLQDSTLHQTKQFSPKTGHGQYVGHKTATKGSFVVLV